MGAVGPSEPTAWVVSSMPRREAQIKTKPKVSIIGAGRLGTALALALTSRGYGIRALVARRLSHARKALQMISGAGMALAENQLAELPASELILIATPDDVIGSVAAKLATASKVARELPKHSRTVLHTSGALSSIVLKPLADIGFHTGSLHPLVSINEPRAGSASLGTAFYCLEGDRAAMRVARSIVKDLGGRSFSIESDSKALYHAAAVMASGHTTALFDVAVEMLTKCGLTEANSRRVLLPLLESTWRNLATSNPAQALTGTFARGDEATVHKHLTALTLARQVDALAIYRLLGQRSLRLLAKNGADPKLIQRIDKMLRSV